MAHSRKGSHKEKKGLEVLTLSEERSYDLQLCSNPPGG